MVEINEFGFYSLKNKPKSEELKEYYSKKYYQNNSGAYEKKYSTDETKYIYNKIEQKHHLISDLLPDNKRIRLLDVGCGEGFCLSYFNEIGWDVLGLDYSEFGLMNHNPSMKDYMMNGDIYNNIEILKQEEQKFDVIWIDNVLEHVLDPTQLLDNCYSLTASNGLLLIEVPNDFSQVQLELRNQGCIDSDFWVVSPDHISYFNREGLTNICNNSGWRVYKVISDFPIDFNIFNENSNYISKKETGRGAHMQRVKVENLMHNISIDKTNRFYEALADLGMGRQIIGVFNK